MEVLHYCEPFIMKVAEVDCAEPVVVNFEFGVNKVCGGIQFFIGESYGEKTHKMLVMENGVGSSSIVAKVAGSSYSEE